MTPQRIKEIFPLGLWGFGMGTIDWINVLFSGAACGAIIAVLNIRYQNKREKLILKIKGDRRADLVKRYSSDWSAGYYAGLNSLLALSNRIWGSARPKPPKLALTFRAFNVCLGHNFTFPVIAALLAWACTNETHIGTLQVFNDVERHWERFNSFAMILGALVVSILSVKFLSNKIPQAVSALMRWFNDALSMAIFVSFLVVSTFAVNSILSLAFGLTGAVAFDFAYSMAFTLSLATAVTTVLSVAVASVTTLGFANSASITLVVVVATVLSAFLVLSGGERSAFLFFFLLLPYANALADWLSLAVTRWFLDGAVEEYRKLTPFSNRALVGRMVLDLLWGLGCLALLLGFLFALLTLWEWLLPGTAPLDPRAYWANAIANPSEGLALWLMCFTTIVPTLVHVSFALILAFEQRSTAKKSIYADLANFDQQNQATQEHLAVDLADRIRALKRWAIVKFTVLMGVCILLVGIFIWLLALLT